MVNYIGKAVFNWELCFLLEVNMKASKKKLMITLITVVCVLSIFYTFNTDRFIYRNIKAIDQAEMITIIGENSQQSYEINSKMVDLVSYGGTIVKFDNLIEDLFNPYYNELDKIDLSIIYKKDNSVLGTAKAYYSNEDSNEYILYLNNIYWATGSNLNDLLDLLNE